MATSPVVQKTFDALFGVNSVYTAVTERLTTVGGVMAGCGEAALLVILHATKGLGTSPDELKALIQQAIAAHKAGPGGVSSPATLQWLAAQYGTNVKSVPFTDLDKYVDQYPVILGLDNASALGGADIGVHGHYITVMRRWNNLYVVSDPYSTESQAGNYVVYSHDQLKAAQPFWAGVVPIAPSAIPAGGTNMSTSDTPLSVGVGGSQSAQGSTLGVLPDLGGVNHFFTLLGDKDTWVRVLKILVGASLVGFVVIYGVVKGGKSVQDKVLGGLSVGDIVQGVKSLDNPAVDTRLAALE